MLPNIANSVQDRSRNQENTLGGPEFFSASMGFGFDLYLPASPVEDIPPWSIYPSRRDGALRRFWKTEPTAAGAVYSLQARIRSLEYNIVSESDEQERYYEELFDRSDLGNGYETLVGKVVTDLLTQDNGAFLEIVGAGDPRGELVGRPTQINHLDSARCWRTFDPVHPVVYWSEITGEYHALHFSRVACMSLHPQPNEAARNIGFCAISRALRAIQIMKAIQIYKQEKITGSRQGIGFGNGFTDKMFRNAITAAENEDRAAGALMWRRVPFMINPDSQAKVSMDILTLAGLPDGFDAVDDMTLYVYALALCFGVDAREFWPATSSGATKADATIQHLKARGKGIGDILQTLGRTFQRHIFPQDKSVEGTFDYTDDEEDRQRANLDHTVITTLLGLLDDGVLTEDEVRQTALSMNVLDARIVDPAKKAPGKPEPKAGDFGRGRVPAAEKLNDGNMEDGSGRQS